MKNLLICLFFAMSTLFAQAEKQTIAVLDFTSNGVSQSEVNALTDRLRSELFRLDTFSIIEREKMIEILNEQGFQQSGCTTSDCAVEIGKLIGVKKIITGSVNTVGGLYTISTRIINIENGKIEKITDYDYKQPPIGIFGSKKSRNEETVGYIMRFGMKFVAKQLIGQEPDYKMQWSPGTIHISKRKKDN